MRHEWLLGLLLAAGACWAGEASAPESTALVFSYSASDGEFSVSLDLYADRRWRRSEHSGTVPPQGRLSPAQMQTMLQLLDAAPFRTDPAPCDVNPIGHADYRDARDDRAAHGRTGQSPEGGWIPCDEQVDPVTARLPSCLEALIDGTDASPRACAVDL